MVLVTGSTGFLGSHLVCQLLANKQQVRACRRAASVMREFDFVFNHYFPNPQTAASMRQLLEWVEADVLEMDTLEKAMQGINQVYHCAALVSFEAADRDKLFQVNIEGTANVVNACLLSGVKNLCYVSSVAALGRTKSGNTMDEQSKWESSKLNSNYAISKYRAELEVWRGAEEGLQVVMVNPGVIIGVGDFTRGSNALIHSIYKGMPFYSMGVNGYVDVKDVARAMLELVQRNIVNERFVMVGANLRFKDLFFLIADTFQKRRPYIEVGPFLAALSWRVMALLRLFSKKSLAITRETARAALNESFYNSGKIKQQLSFTFTAPETTVSECCAAYPKFIQSNI